MISYRTDEDCSAFDSPDFTGGLIVKILVLSSQLEEKHIAQIRKTAEEVKADLYFYGSEKDIPEENKDAEVIYGFATETARTSRDLKWLCVPSAGVDYITKPDSFANPDAMLTNSAGAYGVTIAEHMIAVLLMMMRRITEFHKAALEGRWIAPMKQRSIKNSRITVLGTGDIGRQFAKRAAAFEPAVIRGVSRSGISKEDVFDEMYKVSDLDKLLPGTDVLAMSLPATAETENILNKERLALLPEGAYVVNVGRGSAVDEDALMEALESGHIAGAALDVFKTEPIPEGSRLWNTTNLLITPHVAGNLTLEVTKDRNVEMFCEDLKNYAAGKPLIHLVDRVRGY